MSTFSDLETRLVNKKASLFNAMIDYMSTFEGESTEGKFLTLAEKLVSANKSHIKLAKLERTLSSIEYEANAPLPTFDYYGNEVKGDRNVCHNCGASQD